MSLGIVVLTEEGVVMATESLGTLLTTKHQAIESECSECGHEGKPNLSCAKCNKVFGPVPTFSHQSPVSHTYYCQKLFKINPYVGVITVGNVKLGNIKVQHHLYQFILWLEQQKKSDDYCEEMVNHWQAYCTAEQIIKNHTGKTELIFAGIKLKGTILPYAVNVIMENGEFHVETAKEFGISVAGAHDIIDKIFGGDGIKQFPVKEFPLQDAVEFAEFLIQTQIGVDKYICRISQVGGDIDIAVIHPTYGFKWIKQKKLQQILES